MCVRQPAERNDRNRKWEAAESGRGRKRRNHRRGGASRANPLRRHPADVGRRPRGRRRRRPRRRPPSAAAPAPAPRGVLLNGTSRSAFDAHSTGTRNYCSRAKLQRPPVYSVKQPHFGFTRKNAKLR
ncbi:hypothetical protein MTO96_013916 [Rhipicephalus appendiculatus]